MNVKLTWEISQSTAWWEKFWPWGLPALQAEKMTVYQTMLLHESVLRRVYLRCSDRIYSVNRERGLGNEMNKFDSTPRISIWEARERHPDRVWHILATGTIYPHDESTGDSRLEPQLPVVSNPLMMRGKNQTNPNWGTFYMTPEL